jgi:prepilin-type processing-associated H-X9-DG protein
MKRRSGFTFVELVFVLCILVTLIALLLPAIQSARELARKAQCANNLMQLGIAIASYAGAHSVLPPGVVNETGPIENLPFGYHHSWIVQILPYIDQQNLYNHLDLEKSAYDPANDTAAHTFINTLYCPSDPARRTNHYAGCHHDVDEPINSDNHGVLYLNSCVRYDQIDDGPAFTILLGEMQGEGLSLGWISGTRATLRNTGMPFERPKRNSSAKVILDRSELFAEVEAQVDEGTWPVELTGGFSSFHSSSSNFLFCDGSLRSVKRTIERHVYQRLGNRADGEPISSDTY